LDDLLNLYGVGSPGPDLRMKNSEVW
jgi:hypothetical protein